MLVSAKRTYSPLIRRVLYYVCLFVLVAAAHTILTDALRKHGWGTWLSLLASGAMVLVSALVLVSASEWVRGKRAEHRDAQRVRLKLPTGPCCLVWRPADEAGAGTDMPWEISGPMRARYPNLARRFEVEGYAIAEFEVSAGGGAKNIHCIDAWPSDIFFDSAREALLHARFQPSGDVHVRFGASYRMSFVFRIAGASRLKEQGARARTLRPILHGAQRLVENMRARSDAVR